ncbi:MAG TPA: protein kinase [Nitrososphaeraceae archaeon]|nr:protein kinase [Nitrososphaeraceae archaeon]
MNENRALRPYRQDILLECWRRCTKICTILYNGTTWAEALKNYMAEKFNNDQKYFFDIRRTINTIILPVCNALAQAHGSNVYHRDLKPSNIMFKDDPKSSIKIADWGLAKIEDSSLGSMSRISIGSKYGE